jgi:hypothetical protein
VAARAGDGAVESTSRDAPVVETDAVGGSSEAVGHPETEVGVGPNVGRGNMGPPVVPVPSRDLGSRLPAATRHFTRMFLANDFGYECAVCGCGSRET